MFAERPPIETQQHVKIEAPDNYGHVYRSGNAWRYPCMGCGCEPSRYDCKGPADFPCEKPYTPPEAIGQKLDRIADKLDRIADKLDETNQLLGLLVDNCEPIEKAILRLHK